MRYAYMDTMKTGLISIVLAGLMALPAFASDEARALLKDGAYGEARELALAADTVEGLNIAAEAMAAEIMLVLIEDAKDHAKDAIDLTEEALERDPGNVEAKFLNALHTGFRTRSSSAFAIVMKGLIGDTYEAIEVFEAAAPGDPRADALYGAWHLGIVRAAGDGKFGADLSEGMAHYDRAVEALPSDIVVISNYAFSLICMDNPALLPRAKDLLRQVEAIEPVSAVERDTKDRMMTLLEVFDQPEQLMARAEGLLNTEEVEG